MRKKTLLSLLVLGSSTMASAATLSEAYRAAIAKSESVKQAAQRVVQSEETRTQIRGGIFPQLSLSASHQIQPELSPAFREFSPPHQTTVALSANQALFRGFREWAGLRQSHHLQAAAVAGEAETLTQLFHEVASTYLGILASEQDLKNLDEQSQIYADRVKDLRARVRRGESAQNEALSAEATLNSIHAEMQLGKGQLSSSRETLAFLTGLPETTPVVDPDALGTSKRRLVSLDEYLKRVSERPDVRAAQEQFAAASEAVSVASGDHWPTLDATGNYYLVRPGFLKDLKWDIGIRLSFPLFAGGSTQAGVRSAIAGRTVADLELQKLKRRAVQEIRSYYDQVKTRIDYIERQKRSVELARKSVQLLQRDFRRGLVRNIDIQVGLTELRNAQRGFDSARFAAQLDFFKLQSAAALAPLESKETTP